MINWAKIKNPELIKTSIEVLPPIHFGGNDLPFIKNLVEHNQISTTSQRAEIRAIVDKNFAKAELNKLKKLVNIKKREYISDDLLQNTYTHYRGIIEFWIDTGNTSEKREAKIRTRRYYLSDLGSNLTSSQNPGFQWLEIKIDNFNESKNPIFDKVVNKSRVLVGNEDIDFLFNVEEFQKKEEGYRSEIENIRERVKSLNPGCGVVDDIINLLVILHVKGGLASIQNDKTIYSTYERKGYSVDLQGKDVQVTIDKDIIFFKPKSNKPISQYRDNARVVEIKIPLYFLTNYTPEFESIAKFIENITKPKNQLKGYNNEKGKIGNFKEGNTD